MNREFLINVVFLIFVNLLIKPFYIFGIDRTVQNTVGPEEYGVYFAIFNFTFLMYIINDFGIQSFNSRNISQHNHLLDKYFPNILILKLLLGFLYMAFVFLVAYLSGYELDYYHLIFFMAINHILVSFTFYLRSNIAGLALYRTDSILSALNRFLLIIICSVLLWVPPICEHFRIEWFIYAQTVSLSITALITFAIIKKHLKKLRFTFKPVFLLLILKKSYPYALVLFLMTLYSRIDGVMIERMLPDGQYQAGVYASAFRLLDAGNMIGFLFAGLLLPMFAKMLKEKEDVASLLRFSLLLILIIAISFASSTYFFREEIMNLLYHDATPYWGNVLGYLIISFVAVSGIYIYGTLLTANGSLMRMNAVFVVGIIINVLLNYYLIQQYKALGAAIATCFTQFFVFFAEIFLVKTELNISTNYQFTFRILLYALCATLASYSLYNYFPADWRITFLASLASGMLLSLVLGLFDPKTLVRFINKKRQS